MKSFSESCFTYSDDCRIELFRPKRESYLNTRAIGRDAILRLLTKYRILSLPQIERLLKSSGKKGIDTVKSLKKMCSQDEIAHYRLSRQICPSDFYTLPDQGISEIVLRDVFTRLLINEWHTLMIMHSGREMAYDLMMSGNDCLIPSLIRCRLKYKSITLLGLPVEGNESLKERVKAGERSVIERFLGSDDYLTVILCANTDQVRLGALNLIHETTFPTYYVARDFSDRNPLKDLFIAETKEDRTELERISLIH